MITDHRQSSNGATRSQDDTEYVSDSSLAKTIWRHRRLVDISEPLFLGDIKSFILSQITKKF